MHKNNGVRMQRLIFLLASMFLAGCYSMYPQKQVNFYGVDFSRYSKDGFYFYTTPQHNFGLPIGYFVMVLHSGAKFESTDGFDENGPYTTISGWKIDEAKTQDAIDSFYLWSKSRGANTVSEFEIELITNPVHQQKYFGPILYGVKVSGFAYRDSTRKSSDFAPDSITAKARGFGGLKLK